MADFAPVQESELETGPEPSAGVVGNGHGDLGGFQPVNDNELIPAGGPAGPTGEFAYKGIPAAAAKRFSQSNPLANILGAAATKFSDNFVNNFTSLNDADMKILVENGYGDYSGPGALLQHAADAFNSGATLLKNGIMAGISSIAPTAGAVAGQTVKEAGGSQTEADRAEREFNFDTMAALSDVGAQHGMAMEGAAKTASPEAAAAAAAKAAADEAKQVATAQAQAAAPGIWGHAYRVDGTPDGDLVQTPLGRLPSAAEAASQAQTVAAALHLPPETADVIHKTYVQTGRPPAEVLMDAQTNHGGVLSDLVAGKVPDTYQPTAGTAAPVETPINPKTAGPEDFSDLSNLPDAGQIDQMIETKQNANDTAMVRALGSEENAAEFERLTRKMESSNDARAAEGQKEFDAKFGNLTPEQERLIYGTGETDYQVDDLKEIQKAVSETDYHPDEGPQQMAHDAQQGLFKLSPEGTRDFGGALAGKYGVKDQAGAIRFSRAYQALRKRGLNSAEIDGAIGDAMMRRGIEPADVADILGGIKEAMQGGRKSAGVTPKALAAAKPVTEAGGETPKTAEISPEPPVAPAEPTPPASQGISNTAPAAETGVSKIGQSIEQKAIDAGITDGFLQTAGYDVKTVKGQTALVSDLVTNNPDKMNAIVNGEEPIPHGMDPSMFITGVEEYIKQTKDWDLASRLANSPVVTKTSEAAQTLRFAQERTPDSATARLAEIQKAKEKQAGGPKQIAARKAAVKEALPEAEGVFLPKEQISIDNFLDAIKC